MNEERLNLARTYIKKIRNTEKQQYAKDYLQYLLDKRTGLPEYSDDRLGYLAQQAVRMNLHKLVAADLQVDGEKATEESTSGEAQHWEKTEAGEQGLLIHTQRTQGGLGAKRSTIALKDQLKATMFDTSALKDENQLKAL